LLPCISSFKKWPSKIILRRWSGHPLAGRNPELGVDVWLIATSSIAGPAEQIDQREIAKQNILLTRTTS
jgi:hypothetical protein